MHFVGSDLDRTRSAIAEAAANTPAYRVNLTVGNRNKKSVTASWKLDRTSDVLQDGRGLRLDVILTEDHLVTEVTSGENSGRTLTQDAVLRYLTTLTGPSANSGEAVVPFPDGFRAENGKVLVIARAAKSFEVLGAARVSLAPPDVKSDSDGEGKLVRQVQDDPLPGQPRGGSATTRSR